MDESEGMANAYPERHSCIIRGHKKLNLDLTFVSIALGLVGAAFGTFPSFYANTVGRRRGKLSDAEEALWRVRQKGELSDQRLIAAFLDMVGIPSSSVAKMRAHGGVLFGTTQALNEWINLYDANDMVVPNLNLNP